MKKIAIVILAAGASTRFGQSKQLLDWGGVPLLAHVTDVALSAKLGPVIIVLGCQAEAARAALGERPVQRVMNWRWQEGMSTSAQVGVGAFPPETEAAIFMQCDQPLITADLLQALVVCFDDGDVSIVHPSHDGRRGTPVLFARRHFPEMAAVTGDVGGRGLITRHAEQVATVEVTDPNVLADIDTPADYERLQKSNPQSITPNLQSITHLIIDMDGVLWRGNTPMPGLQAFFAFLRQRHIQFVLATNNASQTPDQYVAKLARFGVEMPLECVLNSAQATASYLSTIASPGTRVYVIGQEGTRCALTRHGFVLTDETGKDAAYVVVGWDRQLTWTKLRTAALLIHGGAGFIGTNPDVNFPTEHGPVPGNGAQLAALEATTGVAPTIIGKPEPWMYEEAMRRMGACPETTAVIGDRLDTDIAGGVRAGLTTVLVLSGIASEDDLATSLIKPDVVCADIQELVQVWKRDVLAVSPPTADK
ncbi:MAG: HAD-IIA family hydrolase [Chloroflexi bacterium]|nr:HAD-IIA family hydrolase [Chloroflexota bacterium]